MFICKVFPWLCLISAFYQLPCAFLWKRVSLFNAVFVLTMLLTVVINHLANRPNFICTLILWAFEGEARSRISFQALYLPHWLTFLHLRHTLFFPLLLRSFSSLCFMVTFSNPHYLLKHCSPNSFHRQAVSPAIARWCVSCGERCE